MTRIRSQLALIVLVFLAATACTTSYTRDGVELPKDYGEALEAQDQSTAPDYDEVRITAAVESVPYERGPELLRVLQWLISMRELAVPVVLDHLDKSDLRSRAQLLYVLGFTRTPESSAALVAHLGHADEVVRFEAAAGLLNHGDTTAVPVLIEFLDSQDRRFRYKSIEALRKVLGQDFGYEFAAPAEIRNVSISRWRDWWASEKTRLMYRPGAQE
ncbi:MAG: HEAT repeat domain-containing protein [Planctomycetes bacterium]|nr:HEAT repeat domain-containing protein [Planctomycetota bacterium]